MTETPTSSDSLPGATGRVVSALEAAGHPAEVRIVDGSAHTAEEAAEALGVDPSQIVKSMVFRSGREDMAVVVLLSGDRQVDIGRLEELDPSVERASPSWVREVTGFAIGGIPPIGHAARARIVLDTSLVGKDSLWAGAGTPTTLFRTTGARLEALAQDVAEVSRDATETRRT